MGRRALVGILLIVLMLRATGSGVEQSDQPQMPDVLPDGAKLQSVKDLFQEVLTRESVQRLKEYFPHVVGGQEYHYVLYVGNRAQSEWGILVFDFDSKETALIDFEYFAKKYAFVNKNPRFLKDADAANVPEIKKFLELTIPNACIMDEIVVFVLDKYVIWVDDYRLSVSVDKDVIWDEKYRASLSKALGIAGKLHILNATMISATPGGNKNFLVIYGESSEADERIAKRISEFLNKTFEDVGVKSYPISDQNIIALAAKIDLAKYNQVLIGHPEVNQFAKASNDWLRANYNQFTKELLCFEKYYEEAPTIWSIVPCRGGKKLYNWVWEKFNHSNIKIIIAGLHPWNTEAAAEDFINELDRINNRAKIREFLLGPETFVKGEEFSADGTGCVKSVEESINCFLKCLPALLKDEYLVYAMKYVENCLKAAEAEAKFGLLCLAGIPALCVIRCANDPCAPFPKASVRGQVLRETEDGREEGIKATVYFSRCMDPAKELKNVRCTQLQGDELVFNCVTPTAEDWFCYKPRNVLTGCPVSNYYCSWVPTQTDVDGNFELALEDGLYMMTATDNDMLSGIMVSEEKFAAVYSSKSPINQRIKVYPVNLYVQGTVKDAATGEPVGKAKVTVILSSGETVSTHSDDKSGWYRLKIGNKTSLLENCYNFQCAYFRHLSPIVGQYTVRVEAEGYEGVSRKISVRGYSVTEDFLLWKKRTPPKPELPTSSTVLVVDVSGSMQWQDPTGKIKLDAAKDAAQRFINMFADENQATGASHQLGIVSFGTSASVQMHLSTDSDQASKIVFNLGAYGGTNLAQGLALANQELKNAKPKSKRIIILLSDGVPTVSMSGESSKDLEALKREVLLGPVAEAALNGYCIYVVGFGKPGEKQGETPSIDPVFLTTIALATGCGRYYTAADAAELANIYVTLRHESLGRIIKRLSGQVQQGEIVSLGNFTVPPDQEELHFTVSWPGSRLDPILIDPSGQAVDDNYPGAAVAMYPNLAHIIVLDPLPGEWQAKVLGSDVPEGSVSFDATLSTRGRAASELGELLGRLIWLVLVILVAALVSNILGKL